MIKPSVVDPVYTSPSSNAAGLIPPRSRMTTPPATRRATTTISTSTFGGHGTTLGYDTEALSIAVGISSGLAYDEPADDAATEEDESARKGDWYVNGDIDVDIDPATVDPAGRRDHQGRRQRPDRGTEDRLRGQDHGQPRRTVPVGGRRAAT